MTAAAVLLLAREGHLHLDAPVRRYLSEYPHPDTTVRHLLAHSAALPLEETPENLAGKTNRALLTQAAKKAPLFNPGTAFAYCNLCYAALAMLIERVSGQPYLDFLHGRLSVPAGVTYRPQRLAEWKARAIGYRRSDDGKKELFDSWEGEAFYGAANLSLSAKQLAEWGTNWWTPSLTAIRAGATAPALIAGKPSGLSLGSWYCAPERRRCHYLGHHEGFHHMLYWDVERRLSVAMVTNNALAPAIHQSLQRALILFAEDRPGVAQQALKTKLPSLEAPTGEITTRAGETITVQKAGSTMFVERSGVTYPAFRTGSAIRYVPGLDGYLAGDSHGRLHWLTLYDEAVGHPVRSR
jgi:CubicO group peptidase (beta-lactamase class C family)